jgi:hypothetical protein
MSAVLDARRDIDNMPFSYETIQSKTCSSQSVASLWQNDFWDCHQGSSKPSFSRHQRSAAAFEDERHQTRPSAAVHLAASMCDVLAAPYQDDSELIARCQG